MSKVCTKPPYSLISLECPVYQKIAQQHEARIAKSRQPSDQPRYVDAPSPERKAWNEKKDWTDRQSGPRVNSRIPQADHGGSRDDSRKPPEQARSHEIQATEGSPKLPLSFPPTPPPHMPGKDNAEFNTIISQVNKLGKLINFAEVQRMLNELIQILENTPNGDRDWVALKYLLDAKSNSGF
ncbi:hypothetical protein JTB14_037318 [Gonioctena quinquepunctata]|nr:hypothetical protein JTB14_037318 [Gonioctena quinquepunctata]